MHIPIDEDSKVAELSSLKEGEAMERWKYFAGTGATDKNTMVTVEALLFGFCAALIAYIVTNLLCFEQFGVRQSELTKTIWVAVLGLALSSVAGFIAFLYAGYSNWNWAQADAIARSRRNDPKWAMLLPESADSAMSLWDREVLPLAPKAGWWCKRALRLGRACFPTRQLAPVFSMYISVAAATAVFFAFTLLVSWLRPPADCKGQKQPVATSAPMSCLNVTTPSEVLSAPMRAWYRAIRNY